MSDAHSGLTLVTTTKRPRGRPRKPTQIAAAKVARENRMRLTRQKIALGLVPRVTLGSKPRYDLAEVQVLLGISLGTVRKRINDGHLTAQRDGTRVFITNEEIVRYCASEQREKDPQAAAS